MAFYNKINDFYRLVGNNVASKSKQSIDTFLNSLPNKYSNAGLILNYIKNKGVSGSITISRLLSNSQYFNILNEALKLARITDTTDFYQDVLDKYGEYTQENNIILKENDLTDLTGFTGNSFSYTTLEEVSESVVIQDFPPISGDVVSRNYKLTGNLRLDEDDTNIYLVPLGLLTLTGDYLQVGFGRSNSTVNATDTTFKSVSSQLAAGCAITDLATGDVVSADVAFVFADNTVLSSDDYLLFLALGSTSKKSEVQVFIDQEIIIANAGPDLKVEFTNY